MKSKNKDENTEKTKETNNEITDEKPTTIFHIQRPYEVVLSACTMATPFC
jgi:hypothetical protein